MGTHKSIAGAQSNGIFLSQLTAEYPASLARQLAAWMARYTTSLGFQNCSISDFAQFLPETYVPRRPRLCNGAGLNSTGDHTHASHGPLEHLAQALQQWLSADDRMENIMRHLEEGLSSQLVDIAHSVLHPLCTKSQCTHISPGQPFRLGLLQAIAQQCNDPDSGLPHILKQGVPTGIFDPACSGNKKEIDSGWVSKFEGTREDAERRWPNRTAIGKLNVVLADGKDPRLVLDSTICNANPLCKIPEHVALPSALDVQRSFLHDDAYGDFLRTALDFKAAHKCVKVAPHEQGTLLLRGGSTALPLYSVSFWSTFFSILVGPSRVFWLGACAASCANLVTEHGYT